MKVWPCLLLFALTACGERDFDDRFAGAEQAIHDKAQAIDAEIAERASGQATPPAPASLRGAPAGHSPPP